MMELDSNDTARVLLAIKHGGRLWGGTTIKAALKAPDSPGTARTSIVLLQSS